MKIEQWFKENCVQQYPVRFGKHVLIVDAENPTDAEHKVYVAVSKNGDDSTRGFSFKALEPQWRMC